MAEPPGPPKSFPPPMHPDDPGRGPLIMGITWTFTSLAVLTTGLRVYVRRTKDRNMTIDDWLMVAAVVLQVVSQSFVTVSYRHGLGKHDTDLELPDQLIEVLKWNWLHTAPGMMVSILARISITILLIRLFGIHKWFKWFLLVLTSIQVTAGVLIFVLTWTQARPVEGLWEVFRPDIKRWDPRIVLYSMYFGQSMNTFADLTYVVIPTAIIWKLQMPLRLRVGLASVMGVSIFTAFLSIMKTLSATSGENGSPDIQYKASMTVLWACSEQACVIFLGCVPPLRAAALNIHFPTFRSVGTSIASFLGTRGANRTWTKGSSLSKSQDRSGTTATGAYHDIEMSTRKLGHFGISSFGGDDPVATYDDTQSDKSLVADGHIRQTRAFTVTCDKIEQQGATAKKSL